MDTRHEDICGHAIKKLIERSLTSKNIKHSPISWCHISIILGIHQATKNNDDISLRLNLTDSLVTTY